MYHIVQTNVRADNELIPASEKDTRDSRPKSRASAARPNSVI